VSANLVTPIPAMPARPLPAGRPGMKGMPQLDYNKSPFLIMWETTQACDLACSRCRASAQPDRVPGELSTEEGENVLRQAKQLGTPIFVLTGGAGADYRWDRQETQGVRAEPNGAEPRLPQRAIA